MVVIEFGRAENLTLDSNSLFLRFVGPDFQDNVAKIKGFWNRVYLKDTKEWEVPFSCWQEIKELYANTYIQYLNEPPKAKFVTDDDILSGLDFNGFNLYDFQLEGVRFGLNHHNFLLLDEQGLGKTLQLLTLARYKKQHRNLKHCLIICGLNSLKFNWVKEVNKFCKDEKTVDATIFAISQIGELVKNISKETMNKYNNIEWNMIKGLRNRIVHDYEGISLKSIWYVIENDLIELKEKIQNILDKEKNNS